MIKFMKTRADENPEYEQSPDGDYRAKRPKPKEKDRNMHTQTETKTPRTKYRSNQDESNRSTSSKRMKGTKHIEFTVSTTYIPPTV